MLGKLISPQTTLTPYHLIILNDFLIKIAQGKIHRAILTFPPRHGKSETSSKLFPAWYLGMEPTHRVMLISYAAEYAATWGRKARDILVEWGPELFNVRVRQDVAARDAWELEMAKGLGGRRGGAFTYSGGGMVTAGIGGPITGKGADLAIIDDPIKNAEEAFSANHREKTWEWFNSTLMSRLQPGGRALLIMTRWHEDDLAGRLISKMGSGGEYWDVLNFPALAEDENDILGRAPGEALWPEQYSAETLQQFREDRGSYWFSALYQQRPVPIGSSIFKPQHLRRYDSNGLGGYNLYHADGSRTGLPASLGTVFCTVDLAVSTKTTADFTVISVWLESKAGDLLLLDVVRIRLEGPDQVPLMVQIWRKWRPAVFYIEQAGFQLAIIQAALRASLPVRPMLADKDKVSRALAPAAKMEAGKVFFPSQAPWLQDVEQELWSFPAGAHDDFVDTLSMAAVASLGAGYVGNLG